MNRSNLPATVAELLAEARARLADPREAVILVAYALELPREALYAHPERRLSSGEAARTLTLVDRRTTGEPVAHLTGTREFYGLRLRVTPAVLIPRPETELLVELALSRLEKLVDPVVADVGTGSGAIALALAYARTDARVIAIDHSAEALAVASANARRLELTNVRFVQANLLAAFADRTFDLVVSNPPYVAAGDPHLAEGDLRFEPAAALAAGPDGLDVIRRLIADAVIPLSAGGTVIVEHGAEQQPAVRALLAKHGYTAIEAHRDLAGLPRAVSAMRA
ncbi:MAG: peptide chain release factor N(5)-glutamine methyltransferase [Gammaproteobacteria bacterium]